MVEPVVSALLTAAEIDSVRLHVGPPVWRHEVDQPDRAPYVWVELSACSEVFDHVVAKVIFERDDAGQYAAELFDALQEWIAETTFGWGQRREGRSWEPPPPSPVSAATVEGARRLEFYPQEGVMSPLWDHGVSVPLESLPISDALVVSAQRWLARWAELTDDENHWPGWLAVTDELEPERQRLVAALNQELPANITVLKPVPLDQVTRETRSE